MAIIKTQIKVLFKITYYSKYKENEILLNLKYSLKVFCKNNIQNQKIFCYLLNEL